MMRNAIHRNLSLETSEQTARAVAAKAAAHPCWILVRLAVFLSMVLANSLHAQTAVSISSYTGTPVALTTTNTGSSAIYVLNSDSSVGILQNGTVVNSVACPAFPAFTSGSATILAGAIYFDPSTNNIYIGTLSGLGTSLAYETLGSGGACTQSPVVQASPSTFSGLQMAVDPVQGNIYLAQIYQGGVPDRLYVASISNLASYSSSSPVPYVQLDYSASYGQMVLDSSTHRLYLADFGSTQNSPPGIHAAAGFFVFDPNQSATLSTNLGFIVGYVNSSNVAIPFYPEALLVNGAGTLILINENAAAAADLTPGTPPNLSTPLTVLNTTAPGFSFFTCPQTGRNTAFATGCYISPGTALSSIAATNAYTAMSAGGIDPVNGIIYGYAYSATVSSSDILTPTPGSGLLLSYNLSSSAETVLGSSLAFATLYTSNQPWTQLTFNPASDDLVVYNSGGGLGVSAPLCSAAPIGIDQVLGDGITLLLLAEPAVDFTDGYLYDIHTSPGIPFLYYVAPPASSCASSIVVPNVVGQTQAAAMTAITDAGLTVGAVTTASSATVPAGSVISQSPLAGSSAVAGSAVNLVVSTGPAMVTVPNVVGLTQAAATTAITGAGLTVGAVTTASSATVPAGSVISQSPLAGSSAVAGSAVNFVVSTGPATVTVPNVVGLTQAAATTAITGAGLTVGAVTTAPSATVAAGSVISQSPLAGSSAVAGSVVNFVVSSGSGAIIVPNVVGLTRAAATTAITAAGLTVGTVTRASSATVPAGSVISQSPPAGSSAAAGSAVNLVISRGEGYWFVSSAGGIYSFGDARFRGSLAGVHLTAPIVGMAATPSGGGYWLVSSAGGIFGFGNARFHGSLAGVHLTASIVGMAATPDGGGYWLVDSVGGIFNFGDAHFHGSLSGVHLTASIVGMAATPDGGGYWLVDSAGGIFNFGDAHLHGSLSGVHLTASIVGMAATPDGGGYWLVDSAGGIFNFGDAHLHGSLSGVHLTASIVGMAPSPDGGGYWLADSAGGIFSFGDAHFRGSLAGVHLAAPIVGIVSAP